MKSAGELAESVAEWCRKHGVVPANGQAAEAITPRTIRYYRTLGIVDAPDQEGEGGYGERHRLQLIGIRILQSQGLPLNRIRQLLYGRSIEELRRIETQGLKELKEKAPRGLSLTSENWTVVPLSDDLLLVSRGRRSLDPATVDRVRDAIEGRTAAVHHR